MRCYIRIFAISIFLLSNTLFAMQRNLWWHNGNCFMNAVIHALYYVPSFRDAVLRADLESLNRAMTKEEYDAARELQWVFSALNGSRAQYFRQDDSDYRAYRRDGSHKVYSYGVTQALEVFLEKAKAEYFHRREDPILENHLALCRAVLGSAVPAFTDGPVYQRYFSNLTVSSFGASPLVVVPLLGAVFRKIFDTDSLWHFSLAANLPFYQIVAQGNEGSLQTALNKFLEQDYPFLKFDVAPKVLVIAVIVENPNTERWPGDLTVSVADTNFIYRIKSIAFGSTQQGHAIVGWACASDKFYFLNSHDSVGPKVSPAGFVGPCRGDDVADALTMGYKPCIYFCERVDEQARPVSPRVTQPAGLGSHRSSPKLTLLRTSLAQLKDKLGELSDKLGTLKRGGRAQLAP